MFQNAYILNDCRKDIVCLHDITIWFSLRADREVFEGECDFAHGADKLLCEMIRVNQFVCCAPSFSQKSME